MARWVGKERADARLYSLHGLRILAIVNLAEAGCSDAEIQEVTNQSVKMIAYYRARADRKRLSAGAHRIRTNRDVGPRCGTSQKFLKMATSTFEANPLKGLGTQGRTRTGTPAKAGDFESPASTIPPLGPHERSLHRDMVVSKPHQPRANYIFSTARAGHWHRRL